MPPRVLVEGSAVVGTSPAVVMTIRPGARETFSVELVASAAGTASLFAPLGALVWTASLAAGTPTYQAITAAADSYTLKVNTTSGTANVVARACG